MDNLTGLMWLKDTYCFNDNDWSGALSEIERFNSSASDCEELTVSYDDWRLPNRREFLTLFDRSISGDNTTLSQSLGQTFLS
jgi:hypothetical protein